MPVMPAILLMTATARSTLEAATSPVAPSAAVSSTVSSPVWASPPSPAIASATAERPLETRTRTAAYARGLARKFCEGFLGLPRSTGASFTRKQNHVIRNGSACCMRMSFRFAARFTGFVGRLAIDLIAKRSNVQSIFVGGVSFRLGYRLR